MSDDERLQRRGVRATAIHGARIGWRALSTALRVSTTLGIASLRFVGVVLRHAVPRSGAGVAARVLVVLAASYLGALFAVGTREPTIEDAFPGLHSSVDDQQQIRLVIVHGIGNHCIGYSSALAAGVADALGMHDRDPVHPLSQEACERRTEREEEAVCRDTLGPSRCKVLALPRAPVTGAVRTPSVAPTVHGFLRIRRFDRGARGSPGQVPRRRPDMLVYELSWHVNTLWAERSLLGSDSGARDGRSLLNHALKVALMDQRFSDAVMYLGRYRPHMLATIFETMCWLLEEDPIREALTDCRMADHLARAERLGPLIGDLGQRSRIYFITHSLGSRLVYDALSMIVRGDQDEETTRILQLLGLPTSIDHDREIDITSVQTLTRILVLKLGGMFMLANQVPLLQMGSIAARSEEPASSEAGSFPLTPSDLRASAYRGLVEQVNARLARARSRYEGARRDQGNGGTGGLTSEARGRFSDLPAIVEDRSLVELANLRVAKDDLLDEFAYLAADAAGFNVVAFSDPDDLLSYRIPGELQQALMPGTRIVNVELRVGAPWLPFVLTDPIGAHGGYFGSADILRLIACGATSDHRSRIAPASCTGS